MAEGLVKPVQQAYANRAKTIDDAVDDMVRNPLPKPLRELPEVVDRAVASRKEEVFKSTTAAESQARMDAIKAKQATDDKAAKGLVKPSMGDRLKKLVGLD
jgi:DNA-binding NtrC family response regulator